MSRLFVNIDVPDIERAVAFYTEAFALRVARRFGPTVVELGGAEMPIYLLEKASGTAAFAGATTTRDYARHWTPIHFDFAVDDLGPALARAVAAGAKAESDIQTFAWGTHRVSVRSLRPRVLPAAARRRRLRGARQPLARSDRRRDRLGVVADLVQHPARRDPEAAEVQARARHDGAVRPEARRPTHVASAPSVSLRPAV